MTSWDGQVVLTTPRLLLRTWREDDLYDTIFHTLAHELAHHFGIDDERLLDIDAY